MRLVVTALLAATLLLSGCSNPRGARTPETTPPAAATGTADPSETVAFISERCTRCHTVDRIKRAMHDEEAWRKTVSRMRERGAALDEAEAEAVIRFLAAGGASQL